MGEVMKEAKDIWDALVPAINAQIDKRIRNCVKRCKMTVTSAPNGSTIGVKEAFGDAIQLPYTAAMAGAQVGQSVWAEYAYAASNMVVVSYGDGSIPAPTVPNPADIINIAHPVKSLYISVDDVDPSTLFPNTTWKRIEGMFLLSGGGDSGYSIGTTGGEATHTLTVDEMPAHDGHLLTSPTTQGIGTATSKYLPNSAMGSYGSTGRGWNTINSNEMMPAGISEGGGGAHNNMPPYVVVNVWQRLT